MMILLKITVLLVTLAFILTIVGVFFGKPLNEKFNIKTDTIRNVSLFLVLFSLISMLVVFLRF